MISELSPLSSAPCSLARFSPSGPTPRRPTKIQTMAPEHQRPVETVQTSSRPMIGNPEPPWLVVPPTAPRNPFNSGDAPLFDFRFNGDVPFSVRFIQAKKKRLASQRPKAGALGSVGNAVWSLACMMEEMQRWVLPAGDEEAAARVRRDTADSVVWLFRKVFVTSPDLVVGLLVLTSQFLVLSMEAAAVPAGAAKEVAEEAIRGWRSQPDSPEMRAYRSWADIGISEGTEKIQRPNKDNLSEEFARRRIAYEQMIVTEKANSMILANYAQLLYQFEKDIDRANDYFRWAVSAEPVDAEARSKYAAFLWNELGDTEAAEEMFLEAIEADPGNVYYHSNYSWFLYKTGGWDTCYPLDGEESDDDDTRNAGSAKEL